MQTLDFCPICKPRETEKYSQGDVKAPDLAKIHCNICGDYEVGREALEDWYGEFNFEQNSPGYLKRLEKHRNAVRNYVDKSGQIKAFDHETLKKFGYIPRGSITSMNWVELQKYKQQIMDIAESCQAENIRLFGSIVRGENNHEYSDIDFLVHMKPGSGLFAMGGLQWRLEELLKCKVDVVPDTRLHPMLKEKILNEAVPL
ncbi:MAG: nucleotidyltransferase family protein [Alphaproteobacteria bacterium]